MPKLNRKKYINYSPSPERSRSNDIKNKYGFQRQNEQKRESILNKINKYLDGSIKEWEKKEKEKFPMTGNRIT